MTVNVVRATATLAVVGSIVSLWPSLTSNNLFALHPALMSIAYLGLMSEGVILAALFRHVDAGADRVAAIRQHAMVQLTSLASLLLGFLAIWKNKIIHHKNHFTSLHGKVGLLTIGMSCASVLLGALSFKALGLINHLPLKTQAQIKGLHRKMAACTWYLSLFTMQLALPHPAVMQGVGCRAWQGCVFALGFFMLVLLIQTGKGKLPTRYYGSAQKLL